MNGMEEWSFNIVILTYNPWNSIGLMIESISSISFKVIIKHEFSVYCSRYLLIFKLES